MYLVPDAYSNRFVVHRIMAFNLTSSEWAGASFTAPLSLCVSPAGTSQHLTVPFTAGRPRQRSEVLDAPAKDIVVTSCMIASSDTLRSAGSRDSTRPQRLRKGRRGAGAGAAAFRCTKPHRTDEQ